jgi:hypothetical protein
MTTKNTAIVAPPAMLAVWNMLRCFDAANISYSPEFSNKQYNYLTSWTIILKKILPLVSAIHCILSSSHSHNLFLKDPFYYCLPIYKVTQLVSSCCTFPISVLSVSCPGHFILIALITLTTLQEECTLWSCVLFSSFLCYFISNFLSATVIKVNLSPC